MAARPFPARSSRAVARWRLGALLVGTLASHGVSAADFQAEEAPPQASHAGLTLEGEGRLLGTDRTPGLHSPLAAANRIQPGTADNSPASAQASLELRSRWRALAGNLLLSHEQRADGSHQDRAQVNELNASADLGAWQFSAGRKVVSWDVGYGFRPNDLVQQEERRQLISTTPMGRPLLQAEVFSADEAASLVWVNPRLERADERQHGADESALAGRLYSRQGALDAYAFGRVGQRTGTSLGTALAWVATDEVELHASARWLQRHEGRILGGSPLSGPASLPQANPWTTALQGHTGQWLLGGTWTGSEQQSLLIEAWHDGTAPSDGQWRAWQQRSAGLVQLATLPGLPAVARAGLAGNLAWQATPLQGNSLRQDNGFVRLAWQPDPWQFSIDALVQPSDRGHSLSAGLQWQGDQWRLNASVRQFGGPADSVLAQVPQRRSAVVSALRSF